MHIHHDHIGSHSHPEATGTEEVKALLSFMIHHNDHHAEELADLLDRLPEKAQKKLMTAIGSFEAANVELKEVLFCLEEMEVPE